MRLLPISFYVGSGLINLITAFVIGFVVILRNPRAVINRTFCLFSFSVASWSFFYFLWLSTPDKVLAEFYMRTLMIAVFFIPPTFAHFVLSFLKIKFNKHFLIFDYLLCAIFASLVYSASFAKGVSAFLIFPFWLIPGPAFHVALIHFFVVVLYCFYLLHRGYRNSKGSYKAQIRYIFIGTAIGYIGGSTNYFIWYRIPVTPFLNILVSLYVVFIAYAIVKHRLMDIRLLVLKSLAYTLTLATVAGSYITITVLVFDRLDSVVSHTLLDVVTLFALVFTFNPLRKFIENHTDRLFSKGRYDFNTLLAHLSDITKKNSRSITGLTAKVMQTLTKEMRINKAALVLTNSPTMASVRTLGFDSKAKAIWDKPTKFAAKATEAIVYDELEENSKEKEMLRKADVQVLIPIKTEHTTEGVLALGEKKSGDMYTSQDLNLLELVAPQIAIALENAKSFKEKEQRIAELKSINKMFHHIEHFLDLDHLLQEIVDEAIKVTGAEGGSLMLLNKGGKSLSIKTATNLHPLISLSTKIKVGEGLAGTVAETQEPLILNGLRDKKFKPYLKREDIVSAISVPMKTGDKLVGVLNVNRKKQNVEFSEENLNIMMAFASQAAEAIVKAGYYHKIEKLSVKNDNQFKEFTKALAKTVDAKDPYTYGHSEAVTGYAMEIAREMGFNEQQLRVLEIGGRLHDMGKIGISERILNKPGSLTDEEFKAIQRHPEIGSDILKDTSSLKGIKDLILYHHERFDGKGYPTGLKGKDIPLGASILAVADTYDAMTSHRAYRPALSKKVAVAEIKKCSGSQFDPEVAKVFLKILERKKLRVIKNTTHQAAFIADAKVNRLDKKAE